MSQYPEIIIDQKVYLKIMPAKELFEKQSKYIELPEDIDLQLAIFRVEGKLYCISNICLHKHASMLHKGVLEGNSITCPLHGWNYKLDTGENTNHHQGIRALKTYHVLETDDWIYIEKPKVEIPKWRQVE